MIITVGCVVAVFQLEVTCASPDPGLIRLNASLVTVRLYHRNSSDFTFSLVFTARNTSKFLHISTSINTSKLLHIFTSTNTSKLLHVFLTKSSKIVACRLHVISRKTSKRYRVPQLHWSQPMDLVLCQSAAGTVFQVHSCVTVSATVLTTSTNRRTK